MLMLSGAVTGWSSDEQNLLVGGMARAGDEEGECEQGAKAGRWDIGAHEMRRRHTVVARNGRVATMNTPLITYP